MREVAGCALRQLWLLYMFSMLAWIEAFLPSWGLQVRLSVCWRDSRDASCVCARFGWHCSTHDGLGPAKSNMVIYYFPKIIPLQCIIVTIAWHLRHSSSPSFSFPGRSTLSPRCHACLLKVSSFWITLLGRLTWLDQHGMFTCRRLPLTWSSVRVAIWISTRLRDFGSLVVIWGQSQ